MRTIGLALALALVAGCAAKETSSSERRQQLEESFEKQIGKATKQDFIEKFGPPQWCRPKEGGTETCRFARKTGTKWVGDPNDKTDRRRVEQYDNVVTDFDGYGTLRRYEVEVQR